MWAAVLALALGFDSPPGPDTLVVCPPQFLESLQPWLAHRAAQGHRFVLVSNRLTEESIRQQIRHQAAAGGLKFVLLVGDAEPFSDGDPALRGRSVPTHLQPAKVNVRWGSEPLLATDNAYADVDDDGIPDLAVGRLSVDSADQLRTVVAKIISYETASPEPDWARHVQVVAGVGGFGTLVDSVLESAARRFLTDGIPASYITTMTYGSWRSPYCPDPRDFHETALRGLNEGCLFWVYVGHGQRTTLDYVRVPGAAFPILGVRDVPRLDCRQGNPIAIFLACYTGAFDQPRECLAEEMLRAPGGPVAVLAGSRVTMPYAMAVLATELMDECFHERRETLGEVVMYAKRRLASDDPNGTSDVNRKWIDAMALLLSPSREMLSEERREHVALFNLLGDPLLEMHYPQPIQLELRGSASAGSTLEVRGTCPLAGHGTLELICRRDRTRQPLAGRAQFEPTDSALGAYNQAYQQANDPSWVRQELTIDAGMFEAQLAIPSEASGACHVRVMVANARAFALGARDVFVQPRPAAVPSN